VPTATFRNNMRDQYAGDISDYLKFAFLRAIVSEDRRLGVAWYYVPENDGRADGRHLEYQREPGWEKLDGEVHSQLTVLKERKVAELERLAFWPSNTLFHRAPVPKDKRDEWVGGRIEAMGDAKVVFLDPDNGLGRGARKHARLADLIALHREDRALAIIKFPGRNKSHPEQISELHQSLRKAGLSDPVTVITCVSVRNGSTARIPRHRFFTIAGADQEIKRRANAFAKRLLALKDIVHTSATYVA
jgi:hypothetical protein